MQNYLDLCRYVLENGTKREDRTGTGTISTFGYQMRCDLEKGFPLLTTKKVYFKAVLGELLWIISGSTNIRPLVLQNIRIWNEWPYESYKKSKDYQGETMDEFIQKIKDDEEFALKYGDLGPVYGKQWRDSYGVDQLLESFSNRSNGITSLPRFCPILRFRRWKEIVLSIISKKC